MASPHVTGVAALAVSRFGVKDPRHKGSLRLAPRKTEFILIEGAAEHACPVPPLFDYLDEGRSAEFTALCEGDTEFNGFDGHGIVDARHRDRRFLLPGLITGRWTADTGGPVGSDRAGSRSAEPPGYLATRGATQPNRAVAV